MVIISENEQKCQAAHYAVDTYVKSGNAIGVGTGTTAGFVITYLAEKIQAGELTNIICIPTSLQTRHLLIENGLKVSDLERNPVLDVAIEGVDEVDTQLNCIKGCGGCLTREKVVLRCAQHVLVVGDIGKKTDRLGTKCTYIPLEVVPFAFTPVKRHVESEEGGQCVLRMALRKAGPVITDNGNYVVDWYFPIDQLSIDWTSLHCRLKLITGLVETGLFVGLVEKACLGCPDGSVREILSEL